MTPENLAILDSYVEILNLYKFINIEISGHTSIVGDEEINMKLSLKRAKMIYDYFISNGVDATQLYYKGIGPQVYEPKYHSCNIEMPSTNRKPDLFRLL